MSRDYTFAFGANPSTNTGLSPTFIYFVNSSGATISPPSVSELLGGLYKVSYNATQMISFILDGATTGLATSDRYISGVFDPADKFSSTLTGVGVTLGAMGATLAGMGNTLAASSATLAAVNTNLVNQGVTLVGFANTGIALGQSGIALGMTANALGATNVALSTNMGSTLTGVGNTGAAAAATLSAIGTLFGTASSSFGSTASDPTTAFGFLRRLQEITEGNQVYTKSTGVFQLFSRGSGTTTLLRQMTVTDTTTSTTRE